MKAKDTITSRQPWMDHLHPCQPSSASGSQWNKPKNLYDTPTFHISSSTAKPSYIRRTAHFHPCGDFCVSGFGGWNEGCVYGTTHRVHCCSCQRLLYELTVCTPSLRFLMPVGIRVHHLASQRGLIAFLRGYCAYGMGVDVSSNAGK